jgi:hypothetical protein
VVFSLQIDVEWQATTWNLACIKGHSIFHFAGQNRSIDTRFFGFDSFAGLPEDWNSDYSVVISIGAAIRRKQAMLALNLS